MKGLSVSYIHGLVSSFDNALDAFAGAISAW